MTSTIPEVSEHFPQPPKRSRAQTRMTDFVQQCKPLSVTKKKQFDEQLTKMIVKR